MAGKLPPMLLGKQDKPGFTFFLNDDHGLFIALLAWLGDVALLGLRQCESDGCPVI